LAKIISFGAAKCKHGEPPKLEPIHIFYLLILGIIIFLIIAGTLFDVLIRPNNFNYTEMKDTPTDIEVRPIEMKVMPMDRNDAPTEMNVASTGMNVAPTDMNMNVASTGMKIAPTEMKVM
jgi:hypothetical protein